MCKEGLKRDSVISLHLVVKDNNKSGSRISQHEIKKYEGGFRFDQITVTYSMYSDRQADQPV